MACHWSSTLPAGPTPRSRWPAAHDADGHLSGRLNIDGARWWVRCWATVGLIYAPAGYESRHRDKGGMFGAMSRDLGRSAGCHVTR